MNDNLPMWIKPLVVMFIACTLLYINFDISLGQNVTLIIVIQYAAYEIAAKVGRIMLKILDQIDQEEEIKRNE